MAEIKKDYTEQTYNKKGFEKGADAIVNTEPYAKRMNIDDIDTIEERTERAVIDDWVKDMKTILLHDTEMQELVCGIHFYCDGDIEAGQDVVVGRDLIVDTLQNITDPDGDAIIPDPTGHAGEVLYHTSTGYGWKKVTEGVNTIRVMTQADFEAEEFVPLTNVLYIVIQTEGQGECKTYYFQN